MARRAGDRFGRAPRFDALGRLDRPVALPTPAGSTRFLDGLKKWDRGDPYGPWRAGMALASQDLFDRCRARSVSLLQLNPFRPERAFVAVPALLVQFPSKGSPEGGWTVTARPRGSLVSRGAVTAAGQTTLHLGASGIASRVLIVDLEDWRNTPLPAASALIGELVEDSVRVTGGAAQLLDDDDAIILLCLSVYPETGRLVFDATRRWRRRTLSDGRQRLQEEPVALNEPLRFRIGHRLTQSTNLSCNCPSFIGMELERLQDVGRLGTQAFAPVPGGQADFGAGRFDGMARRFFLPDWRRLPMSDCKHIHAVRFWMGCPLAEPENLASLASDYWTSRASMEAAEEMIPSLSRPAFLERLERSARELSARAEIDGTLVSISAGDAASVVVGAKPLDPTQVSGSVSGGERGLIFNLQQPVADPMEAEDAVIGDVWIGRGTLVRSQPYLGPGELLDAPFVDDRQEPVSLVG